MLKYLLLALSFYSTIIFAHDRLYICCIFQNEARFLDEWIQFHLDQGVSKIYMYNNRSSDNYLPILIKHIAKGKVVLKQWPFEGHSLFEWNAIQCNAYMDCIHQVKGKCDWCAFIDTDEFLFSPSQNPLNEVLLAYSDCDQIGANWVMYGSSGIHRLQPSEKVTQNMLMRGPLNFPAVKSIVRPEKVSGCGNPHFFIMLPGSNTVNENKQKMEGAASPYSANILRINHYWSRDLDFLHGEKYRRQRLWVDKDFSLLIERDQSYNQFYDPILLQ